ncbi:E1-E2 ATPase [Algoriphagus antarcticus]|uniref:E1-E2 ATPase n=1 Tax=Algoriphagus antarcticus TaxID=238540 RepID=A0A3E0D527_9BACT|nr:hypothetical protein [Algoriphagus antarcticus]REG77593.1 E1-E2 ATPase [Algoriphagus antarcticus]
MKDTDAKDLAITDVPQESRAFSGTINGNGTLEIKVLQLSVDSTVSRLITLVNEAKAQKSPTQLLTDKFEKFFVPSVLILVLILCFAFLVLEEPFSESFYRAIAGCCKPMRFGYCYWPILIRTQLKWSSIYPIHLHRCIAFLGAPY